MAIINEGSKAADHGILQAVQLVEWKSKQGMLKMPVAPSKVIISPQLKAIKARRSFLSKEIKGLAGMHICIDATKGIYLSGGWGIGAPAMIAVCEELHALGTREFYLAGVCGRLTDDISEEERVVASSALREEGTSQHYLPHGATEEVPCHDAALAIGLAAALNARTGKFVSTDAPYRETPDKYNEWCGQGATMIDMETSALYAFGKYYDVKACTVGVAADSLAGGKWTMAGNYLNVEKQLSKLIDNLVEIIAQ